VQVSVYVAVFVNEPVEAVPDSARFPDQAPEATHDVALVLDQDNAAESFGATTVGSASRVTVGAGVPGVTVTVADALPEPPAPVHCSVNVLLTVSGPVSCVPEVALLPAQAPDAVHEEALAADQVSVELPFMPTDAGLAARVTAGAGMIDTVTESEPVPPDPVQVRLNAVCTDRGPTD
jgi:hypothetical protein